MENKTQKALVVKVIGQLPVYDETEIPQPKQNEVLIKVIASTINPSDRAMIRGAYRQTSGPFVAGLQGYGQIVKSGSPQHKQLVGKKVSFTTMNGAWAEYAVAEVQKVFEIDSDVPVQCSASGIVNPLTTIGIVDTYQKWSYRGKHAKGLINTAAASALGRMLNKYCQREGIPLLNIVRRKEQIKILEDQGAKFIIDTSKQGWVEQYKEVLKTHGFNVLFDAIGGGEVTEKLISNLLPGSQVYVYGKLTSEPFTIKKPIVAFQGTSITGFMLFEWFPTISKAQDQKIRKSYSSLLKNQLSTTSLKQVKLADVPQVWADIEKNATEGKFTIIF